MEPWWYYTILEPIDEPTDEPPDNYEELKVKAYWTHIVSSFVESHDPANIVQFVPDMFSQTVVNKLEEVTVHLLDL